MKSQHEEFTKVWQAEAPRILAYARRHVGDEQAHDVVAEAFLIAWRRWHDVPEPAIAWLIVTARQVMSNRVRTVRRNQALTERIILLDQVASFTEDTADLAMSRRERGPSLGSRNKQHGGISTEVLCIFW